MLIAINLSTLIFTENCDNILISGTILPIINTGIAYTLAGDDEITGISSQETSDHGGVYNKIGASIDTGTGNDSITGIGKTGIINIGTIDLGEDSDTIMGIGSAFSGIYNYGNIYSGEGKDVINGINTLTGEGYGLYNQGIISTDTDDDTIAATGDTGIQNALEIDTGDGNDIITGNGGNFGIYNYGLIDTGNGNDIITGSGSDSGIYNYGTINAGTGDDIIDALTGGFDGNGTINLGDGNDVIKGFGSGFFYGGWGKDNLFFETGTYTVLDSISLGFYTINNGEMDMFVHGFGFIGSASDPNIGFSFSSVIGKSFTI